MQHYTRSVQTVLGQIDSYGPRDYLGRRRRLPGGIPFRFSGPPVRGPQAVTVTIQVRGEDLKRVISPETDRHLAYVAGSHFAHVYQHLNDIKIEFTLPPEQWQIVPFGELPQHKRFLAMGKTTTGYIAQKSWSNPHTGIFGSTQYGKSVLLTDLILGIAKAYSPEECKVFICNPKNTIHFHSLQNLAHLGDTIKIDYADCERMLLMIKAEALERRKDLSRRQVRWVVFIDEVGELVEAQPAIGEIIRSIAATGAELNINLFLATQAANPRAFGERGSLTKANFGTRIGFHLPNDQAYLVTGKGGSQYPIENLGGKGDCIACANGIITRFRAALFSDKDFEDLPRVEIPVATHSLNPSTGSGQHSGQASQLIIPDGDILIDDPTLEIDFKGRTQHWTPEKLGQVMAYLLVNHASAERTRQEFRIGTPQATVAKQVLEAMRKWRGEYKK